MRIVDIVLYQFVPIVAAISGLLPHQHRKPLNEDLTAAANGILHSHTNTLSRPKALRLSARSCPSNS
jgi:hypothetical protein